MPSPKVSIIMPSLNVGSFIRECIESAVSQTLQEIEILCVDAGSTDGTLEILQEYAQKDSRIRLIHSDVRSYGYQMNLGLDAASGEYIGILETDDWAEPNMFEAMYRAAKEHDADMIKTNYFKYTTKNGICNEPLKNLDSCPYDRIFAPIDVPALFSVPASVWSGLYQKKMLTDNRIRFNETPGASFQDTSFYLMVCTCSQRCLLLRDCFLHYRSDNDGSSVHSKGKIFCITDEMRYFEAFLDAHPEIPDKILPIYHARRFDKYNWNMGRLDAEAGYSFLPLMHKEISAAFDAGLLRAEYFTETAWKRALLLINAPVRYLRNICRVRFAKEDLGSSRAAVLLKASGCTDPQISVILPFFNAQEQLENTLNSLVSQSFQNIEILCVDDGSTDGSRKIAEKFAAGDDRITLIDMLVHAGPSASRNAAIRNARGKYIVRIDSNTSLLPNALAKLHNCAEYEQLDILYFGKDAFTNFPTAPSAPVAGESLLQQLQKGFSKYGISLQLIRKSFLEESKPYFREETLYTESLVACVLAAKAKRVLCAGDTYCANCSGAEPCKLNDLRKCADLCVMAAATGIILATDQALSETAKSFLLIYGQEALGEARLICEKLPAAHRKKLIATLPVEYRFLCSQVLLASADTAAAKKEALAVKNSSSYRIGSAITFIPRKIRSFVRCAKQYGIGGAFRRILAKLGRASSK